MVSIIDQHPMKPLTSEQLRELQSSPTDEFGVKHHERSFSEKENKVWCILDAPNREAVERHHAKADIKTDWIYEVKTTRD